MGLLDKFSKKKDGAAEAKKDEKPVVKKVAASDEDKPAKKAAAPKAAEAKKSEPKTAKKVSEGLEYAYRIIGAPVLTEKGDRQKMYGKYSFYVSSDANKVEIARAIRDLYGVKPVSVRVLNASGKKVRVGRSYGKRMDRKKAVVTLKQGDSLNVTESA